MKRWSQLFVGREPELLSLQTAWSKVKFGDAQSIAFVADSGVGKTRIVQEFFSWLSTTEEGAGSGYWPDRLARVDDNLQVNPPISDCAQDGTPMEFLWWGLRLVDRGGRNEVTSSAVRAGVGDLEPHLAAMQKVQRLAALRSGAVRDAAEGGFDVAVDAGVAAVEAAVNVATFGLVGIGRTLVSTTTKLAKRQSDIRAADAALTAPSGAAATLDGDLVTRIVTDLRLLCKAPPKGASPIPIVVFFDDVQWIMADPSAPALLEALVRASRAERWPLLIILTSWEQEWRTFVKDESPVARLWAAQGASAQTIFLDRVRGLDSIVHYAFPGVTGRQLDAFLDRADGNPEILDRMLRHFDSNPRFFESRSLDHPLNADGVAALAATSPEQLVSERLADMPLEVRGVVGAASLQGIQFSPKLAVATASRLSFANPEDSLSLAEDPFALVTSNKFLTSEFRRREYQAASRTLLANLVDLSAAEAALSASIQEISGAAEADPSYLSLSELDAMISAAASSSGVLDAGQNAAVSESIRRAMRVYDYRGAAALAKLWIEFWEEGRIPVFGLAAASEIAAAFATLYGDRRTLPLMRRILDAYGSTATQQDRAQRAFALSHLGRATQAVEGATAALPFFQEALDLFRRRRDEDKLIDLESDIYVTLWNVGDCLVETEGPKAAKPAYSEAVERTRFVLDKLGTSKARRDFAVAGLKLGDATIFADGPAVARPLFVESTAQLREIFAESPSPDARRDLRVALERLGDVEFEVSGAAARPIFEELITICRQTLAESGTPDARRALAISHLKLGSLEQDSGRADLAWPHIRQALDLLGGLVEEFNLAGDKRQQAAVLLRGGDAMIAGGDVGTARLLFKRSLETSRSLAATGLPQARRDLALALQRVGDAVKADEGSEAAAPYFVESDQMFEALAKDFDTRLARRDRGVALLKLGEIDLGLNNAAAALDKFSAATETLRVLLTEEETLQAQRDVSVALNEVGRAQKALGRKEDALKSFSEALDRDRVRAEKLNTLSARADWRYSLVNASTETLAVRGPRAADPLFLELLRLSDADFARQRRVGALYRLAQANSLMANCKLRKIDLIGYIIYMIKTLKTGGKLGNILSGLGLNLKDMRDRMRTGKGLEAGGRLDLPLEAISGAEPRQAAQ